MIKYLKNRSSLVNEQNFKKPKDKTFGFFVIDNLVFFKKAPNICSHS